jgi:hypothetical protein
MMVDKLLMGFPQKAAGSNPAGGTPHRFALLKGSL